MRFLVGVCLIAASHSASGATLYSASQGADSPTCGAAKTPCRSISRAIANAAIGDVIIVGPGYYGDLNADGDFADPGEEAAEIGSGCDCVVKIDKRVTVRSRDGAGATVIDARGNAVSTVSLVGAGAAGATFGGAQAGFTVRGGQGAGVFVEIAAENSRILGNIAESNPGDGLIVVGNGATVAGNRAIGNLGNGIQLAGDAILATDDVATANALHGFLAVFGLGIAVERCVAAGNAQGGFVATLADVGLTGVAATGNALDGVFFDGSSGSVTHSSLIGNGRVSGTNCGVLNGAGQAIAATSNYWGAAAGPGADPADDVCNTGAGSTTTTSPFKTSEIRVRPRPTR